MVFQKELKEPLCQISHEGHVPEELAVKTGRRP